MPDVNITFYTFSYQFPYQVIPHKYYFGKLTSIKVPYISFATKCMYLLTFLLPISNTILTYFSSFLFEASNLILACIYAQYPPFASEVHNGLPYIAIYESAIYSNRFLTCFLHQSNAEKI